MRVFASFHYFLEAEWPIDMQHVLELIEINIK